MSYIYDIILNFNKNLIEFFEWEDSDDIKYVKKVAGKDSVYYIRDVEVVKQIYLSVQKDVDNINAHQRYSAALLHYCKFLALKIKVAK